MCSSASPTRWCVQGVCLIRARETTVKSMHDHPAERRAASAPTKSRYAQNCPLFPKGSRSPASPAHLKKATFGGHPARSAPPPTRRTRLPPEERRLATPNCHQLRSGDGAKPQLPAPQNWAPGAHQKNLGTSRSVTLRARLQFGTRGAESTTNRRELDDEGL